MGMDFKKIKDYINNIVITSDLLEIGSDRGEGSTQVLSDIAVVNQKILHSVDVSNEIIQNNINQYNGMPVKFYNTTGENFLDQHSNLKFSVVLLDNFDWNWGPGEKLPDNMLFQIKQYKDQFNLEMTNINSQQAHLIQALKLTNMLAEQCIVVCDDTFIDKTHHSYEGKCGAAVPYLLTLGFTAHVENVGIVLVRK